MCWHGGSMKLDEYRRNGIYLGKNLIASLNTPTPSMTFCIVGFG